MGFWQRVWAANLPAAKRLLFWSLRRNPQLSALFHTTFAVTKIQGGSAANVLPETARATVDARLLQGDTGEKILDYLKALTADLPVTVEMSSCQQPSPLSPYQGNIYQTVVSAVEEIYGRISCIPVILPALVDAGTPDCRESLLEYLQEQRLEEPKYVFASHPHADHIGSMAAVIDAFGCQTFVMPDMVSYTRAFETMLDSVERCGAETRLGQAGDTFELGQAQLELLWPAKGYEADDANNISLVIRVTYGPYSFLLTGDAETPVEKEFASSAAPVTVLKAGHHGSKTSSSKTLLDVIQPEYCVVSVGAGNSYGHPSQEVLDRLERMGCQIYRTDLQGTVVVRVEEGQLYVDTAR